MRPIIILTIVGILSATLLAVVEDLTREPIAVAKEQMKRKAIQQIFQQISGLDFLEPDI